MRASQILLLCLVVLFVSSLVLADGSSEEWGRKKRQHKAQPRKAQPHKAQAGKPGGMSTGTKVALGVAGGVALGVGGALAYNAYQKNKANKAKGEAKGQPQKKDGVLRKAGKALAKGARKLAKGAVKLVKGAGKVVGSAIKKFKQIRKDMRNKRKGKDARRAAKLDEEMRQLRNEQLDLLKQTKEQVRIAKEHSMKAELSRVKAEKVQEHSLEEYKKHHFKPKAQPVTDSFQRILKRVNENEPNSAFVKKESNEWAWEDQTNVKVKATFDSANLHVNGLVVDTSKDKDETTTPEMKVRKQYADKGKLHQQFQDSQNAPKLLNAAHNLLKSVRKNSKNAPAAAKLAAAVKTEATAATAAAADMRKKALMTAKQEKDEKIAADKKAAAAHAALQKLAKEQSVANAKP